MNPKALDLGFASNSSSTASPEGSFRILKKLDKFLTIQSKNLPTKVFNHADCKFDHLLMIWALVEAQTARQLLSIEDFRGFLRT